MGVKVSKMIEDLKLEVLVKGDDNEEINVSDINRPGLQLSGFYNYFAGERVQVIGNAEWSFLDSMSETLRKVRLRRFFETRTPCTIVARGLEPHVELIEAAKEYNRWVLRTNSISTRFVSKIMNYLDEKLAPETRLHGVLVDVYGIGILITGESGIGKSEAALELIKRGHRLVADDAVDIKQIDGTLYGTSPYITQGMIEVRGMGIIDVPALYGQSSVSSRKIIDLVIAIEIWGDDDKYDRLGIDDEFADILNIKVKKITLPIRPGRNLAVLIEAAAANYRYGFVSKNSAVDTIEERMNSYENENTKR